MLEFVYTGLLAAVSILVGWCSFYVVYKLYNGQG